jgi:hypothetical protein
MLKNFPILSEERINDYITKVMPFNEGYNFLKGSNTQYNLRSQLARELKPWASYYNISDEQDPKIKKQFLKSLKC